MVAALLSEMELRRDYLDNESIETIYFGGGTPSLLNIQEVELLLRKVLSTFNMAPTVEITIETNPDDVTEAKLKEWKAAGVNRR